MVSTKASALRRCFFLFRQARPSPKSAYPIPHNQNFVAFLFQSSERYCLKGTYKIETDIVAKLAEELSQALFNAEDQSHSLAETINHYRYLEPKPNKKTKQLGIKGRNILVWHLVWTMRSQGFTIEEIAEGYGLRWLEPLV